MQDVSNNHDSFTLKDPRSGLGRVELASQGVEIEQSLTGMTVQTVTAIEDHGAVSGLLECCRQLLRHPCGTVANHQNIGPHGDIGAGRIEHTLPLAQGTA